MHPALENTLKQIIDKYQEQYHIENGVLYVYGFKERPDYFKLGGFDDIRKLVLSDEIREKVEIVKERVEQ